MDDEEEIMICPHCGEEISPEDIKSEAAKLVRAAATKSPTPKKKSKCKYCRRLFGFREMRIHIPRCEANPNRRPRK